MQEHTGEIRTLARRAAQDIVEIGERLIEVKDALEHGQFRAWLEKEFGWGKSTAHNFMQVAETFRGANVQNLDISTSALYALASGTTPPAIREEVIERAQAGEPITRKLVTERLEQHHQQFRPEPAPPPASPPSPPPVVEQPAPEPPCPPAEPPAPPATPVRAAPAPAPVKRPFTPLSRELEPLELVDSTVVQVPTLPLLPREQELRQKDYAKAAARFDSAASKVLAALTALDVYSMEEVAEIAESPEGRQLYAPVRVTRIKEMLEELGQKWLGAKSPTRTIDAEPLLGKPPKTLDALN